MGCHIFLTKSIFPDRAAVQHYYVRGSHIFLTKAIFPDKPIVHVVSYRSGCITIWGVIFSWQNPFFLTELQYSITMWEGLTFSWQKPFFLTDLVYAATLLLSMFSPLPGDPQALHRVDRWVFFYEVLVESPVVHQCLLHLNLYTVSKEHHYKLQVDPRVVENIVKQSLNLPFPWCLFFSSLFTY